MTDTIRFLDKKLYPIWEKVLSGERLMLDDGITMFESPDIIGIGRMASIVQRWKCGDAVFYAINQKIEPSNVCVLTCRFCNFSRRPDSTGAYEMTIPDILAKITPEVSEVHITGGLHPNWDWNFYLTMISSIHDRFPSASIKAFTAVELDYFEKKFKLPVTQILAQLKEAGLQTLPGGGAEVFSERVRKELFPQKIGAARWLEIHKVAHKLGIPTNATLLYGHIETVEERVRHLLMLRELQDETGGFLTFIPLAFQPGTTGIKPASDFTSSIDDLKVIAISRLMLDNIPHIKAYWVMLTEEVASVALNFGADDLDGTVGGETIAHDAGAISPMKLAEDHLIKLITDAGKIAVRRDTLYHPLELNGSPIVGKIPYFNSVPFYHHFGSEQFKLLPITPRRMGLLAEAGRLDAGLFSLVDYLRLRESFTLLPYGIATRDQVKSVMLFSKFGWGDLGGKSIGIVDDTATSVKLLTVLANKKYNVKPKLIRMPAGATDFSGFDAVLLIGDLALSYPKTGGKAFDLVYDLAAEWYHWQQLPFVFAAWSVRTTLDVNIKERLTKEIEESLRLGSEEFAKLSHIHARHLGLDDLEAISYLEGFNYTLGEQERRAIVTFDELLKEVEVEF
jgi:aminodeoxyfutalosine synthase